MYDDSKVLKLKNTQNVNLNKIKIKNLKDS